MNGLRTTCSTFVYDDAELRVYELDGYPSQPTMRATDKDTGADVTLHFKSREKLVELRDLIDACLGAARRMEAA